MLDFGNNMNTGPVICMDIVALLFAALFYSASLGFILIGIFNGRRAIEWSMSLSFLGFAGFYTLRAFQVGDLSDPHILRLYSNASRVLLFTLTTSIMLYHYGGLAASFEELTAWIKTHWRLS